MKYTSTLAIILRGSLLRTEGAQYFFIKNLTVKLLGVLLYYWCFFLPVALAHHQLLAYAPLLTTLRSQGNKAFLILVCLLPHSAMDYWSVATLAELYPPQPV